LQRLRELAMYKIHFKTHFYLFLHRLVKWVNSGKCVYIFFYFVVTFLGHDNVLNDDDDEDNDDVNDNDDDDAMASGWSGSNNNLFDRMVRHA